MFYVFQITVPANTPEAAAITIIAPVCHGVVHRVEIEFEKWCANLLHVQILRFEHMVWPSGPDQSFASDGETIGFNEYFEVFHTPFIFKVRAWNTDDFFPWTARVRIGIIPRSIAEHTYGKLTRLDRKRQTTAIEGTPPGG